MQAVGYAPCRFYEWKKEGSKKQPYYIYLRTGEPMVMAALFDSWRDEAGERGVLPVGWGMRPCHNHRAVCVVVRGRWVVPQLAWHLQWGRHGHRE